MAVLFHLSPLDPGYPARLRGLSRPPPSITIGGGALDGGPAVAIVGSRKAHPDAERFAHDLAVTLVRAGVVVVSGGARGIDAAAHRGALEAGGRTWAVAATGCERCFPPTHAALFEAIARGPGAMVWPFAPSSARTGSFLVRNRVLVALADAVVVVQARLPSGALLAAACARTSKKPLWVVPASPWARGFEGSRNLLDEGTRPLVHADTLLRTLDLVQPSPPPVSRATAADNPIESSILQVISGAPLHLEEIAHRCALAVAAAAAALLTLALEAVVVEGPPGFFRRCDNHNQSQLLKNPKETPHMGKTLVVVESPAKAKTIKKYLGSRYEVLASKGHIKDLPKKLGVDIEKGFQETYEVVPGKEKVLQELKDAAGGVDEVLLATDPDREGEAIAWHIADELKSANKSTKRVEFHEITKKGVEYGVSHPRELDKHLYDAQRARRVLDRIVGYDVSALVWSKLAFGLSAGRVQSVALRLIVDREREIGAFVPEEYWNCGACLARTNGSAAQPFTARLASRQGEKLTVRRGDEAARARVDLEGARYRVTKVTKSERKRNPPPPYTTSKLQQDAVNRLGFGAKRAMQIAQGLYEGVDLGKDGGPVGLITYMRTDSTRLSPDAVNAARDFIAEKHGKAWIPAQPNVFKSKKNAQDAHEAIRPTSLELPPESVRRHLKDDQFKLYKLIWERFVASQMSAALYDQTSIDIEAVLADTAYGLRAGGRILRFNGWLDAYGKAETGRGAVPLAGEGDDDPRGRDEATVRAGNGEAKDILGDDAEASLPELAEGQALHLVVPPGVITEQKFTQPPPRYTEASLVRELEERGIGRPSTYAEIISKVQARDYVEKMDGTRFRPTLLGKFVVDGLVRSELDFMDPAFTSKMEEELDEVEAGKEERVDLLKRFYKRFRAQLDQSKKGKRWNPDPEPTTEKCELCGGMMLKRWSRNGWFLGCSNYPECKSTRDLGADGLPTQPRETGIVCDKCGKGMVIRSGRFGEFLSCTGYPECKNAKPVPLGVKCPKCGGDLIEIRPKKRGGKTFYGCSNYADEHIKCDFKIWQKPIPETCPDCQAAFLVMAGTRARPMIACANKACGYKRAVAEPDASGPVAVAAHDEQSSAAV